MATGSSVGADSSCSCCPSCWLSSQEGSRLAWSKSPLGLPEQHSLGARQFCPHLPSPCHHCRGPPACPIGSAAGRRDAESKEQPELPTRLHSLGLPGKGTGRHVALARLSAGGMRARDAGSVLGSRSGAGASKPAGCGAWARSSSLHQPLEAPGTDFAAGRRAQALQLLGDVQKLGPSTRELLHQQRGCRGAHPRLESTRRAAQNRPRDKAPARKALRNPSQAAKKWMRDSSVGHQAPSAARGAPRAAPAGARHAERCQEAVPAGRGGRRQPSGRQQPRHSVRRAASAQGLFHPIRSLGRSGSTEAPAQPRVAPWPPSPHHQQPSNQPLARRPHQAQLFPPHSLFFFFFFFGSARCREQKFP